MLFYKNISLYLSCATGTGVWQNGGRSSKFEHSYFYQHLWFIEHLSFDFPHFAKPQTVVRYAKPTLNNRQNRSKI